MEDLLKPRKKPKKYYYCLSVEQWQYDVGKHTVKLYIDKSRNRRLSCSCNNNKQGTNCKHIKKASEKYCGWTQLRSNEKPKQGKKEMLCPKCGNLACKDYI